MTSVPVVPVDPALAERLTDAADRHRQWGTERDRLIVQAVRDGGSLREVAELVGLSHAGVRRIVERGK